MTILQILNLLVPELSETLAMLTLYGTIAVALVQCFFGYRLQQQTFDDETEFTGNGHEVVEWIFQRAGIINYSIGPSTASNNWVFEPNMTF